MRIAVLLSGHLRTWEFCKQNFIDNIQQNGKYEVDVFVHIHDHLFNPHNHTWNEQKEDILITNNTNIFDGINIKDIVIDTEEQYKKEYMDNYINYSNNIFLPTYIQGIKLKLCNLLRKNYEEKYNVKYDLVVRMRPDILLFSPLNYDDIIKRNKNVIVNCYGGTWGFPNDMFAIGKPEEMDLYCNRIDIGIEELKKTYINDSICSHNTMKLVAQKYGLSYENSIKIDIVRPNIN